jgi:hypothetical protein
MIIFKEIGKSPYIGLGEVKFIEGPYNPENVNRKIVVVSRDSRDMIPI